jgi:SPP1 gp7 family putative phage head morphogenesis protein
MAVNDELFDAGVNHQIDLIRYSNSVIARMIALLNKVDVDLFNQLTAKLESAPESLSVARIEALLTSVRKINADVYAQMADELNSEFKQFVDYEIGYQKKLFEATLPSQVSVASVAVESVYAAAMAQPFQGKLLREYIEGLEAGKAEAIRNAVRMGYVEGQTTGEIVRRIRGTRALNYADGLLETNRRGVEAIVRTAINHIGNFSRSAFYEANKQIIKLKRYTATLDSRTTELCASRDGNVYPLDNAPALPAHINCRSVYVPIVKSFRELGLDIDEFSESTRASMDGQVPASMNYQTWLKKQPVARQVEVLGKIKAALFRDGSLTLDRFVNNQGHVYTLAELRVRDAVAFEKLGL